MKFFVTGGAGYIGSAVAEELLKLGHHVTAYDSLVTGHREAVPQAAQFIQADLADETQLKQALSAGFDAVVHFAAFIEAGESMQNPAKYFENNTINSLRLMAAADAAGIKRFLLSSTAAVYQTSDELLTEDSPLGPQNVYGETKLMIEQALEGYRLSHGWHYAALRYFNAAGALPGHGENHQPESHLIPLTLRAALDPTQKIDIYGTDYSTPDGTCIRDYIHLADLVSAHVLSLNALEQRDKLIYNVGTGQGYSVREVIETARKVTGQPINAQESARRPGDPARLVASSAKIQQELGWKAEHSSLEEIIRTAWEWHKK